jgi:hypothetical protein
MKSALIIIALLLAGLFSGCATGPRFVSRVSVPKDKAVVYVYRERQVKGSAGYNNIYINGEKLGAVKAGAYYIYYAKPGELIFSQEAGLIQPGLVFSLLDRAMEAKKNAALVFNADAATEYFVEWGAYGKMETRDYEAAINILKDCSLQEPEKE